MQKKGNNLRIAVFPAEIDPLFLQYLQGAQYFYAYVKKSEAASWFSSLLPADSLIPLSLRGKLSRLSDLDTNQLVRRSDADKLFKQKKINALLPPHRANKALRVWCQRRKIKLLGTEYGRQVKFENKIWFDRYLKSHSLPKPASEILKKNSKVNLKGKLVAQIADSYGSYGTFVLANKIGLNKGGLRKARPLLLREFVKGSVYGITALIGAEGVGLSALRSQCFYPKKINGLAVFAGVQWIPWSSLSRRLVGQINEVFEKLTFQMRKDGYFGIANFDFIVDSAGAVKIIECNPRFSSATPHLLSVAELMSRKLEITSVLGLRSRSGLSKLYSGLPRSKFSGAVFDLVCQDNIRILRTLPRGSYELDGLKIRYLSRFPPTFDSQKKYLLFTSSAEQGDDYKKGETFASVFSNFPLFDSKGQLNGLAQTILKYFNLGSAY